MIQILCFICDNFSFFIMVAKKTIICICYITFICQSPEIEHLSFHAQFLTLRAHSQKDSTMGSDQIIYCGNILPHFLSV